MIFFDTVLPNSWSCLISIQTLFTINCIFTPPLPTFPSLSFSSCIFLALSSALSLLLASLTFALLFNVALPSSPNHLHHRRCTFTSLPRSKSLSQSMILLQSHSRFLLQTLLNRVQNFEKAVELDCNWVEFDDLRYHVQASIKNPHLLLLSVSLPTPPAETTLFGGLPNGAIEAIKAAYGVLVQILDPPRDGFNLTLKLNLSKLPPKEEYRHALLIKIASVREVVLGAPLRAILKDLGSKAFINDVNKVVALVHRRRESFFLIPQAEKVTVVFPMRFKDTIDIALAKSFLQEFVEARRTASLNNAPLCSWTQSSPLEIGEGSKEALSANAGFVSFVIFPRHVDGKKLDSVVWSLSTFHAYVSYHVKCSEGFMHTRMRRRVESLIQSLERAQTNPNS